MTAIEFINQAHPSTIDWVEQELMGQLKHIDQMYKAQQAVAEFRNSIKEVTYD